MSLRFTPALSNLTLVHQGKTRDTFATKSPNSLLIVATRRLSTHDVVHQSEVPYKDEVLTALTVFWIKEILEKACVPHHLLAYGAEIYDHLSRKRADYERNLHHRSIVVRKLSMIPIEFIYRMYMAGSLFKKYYSKGLPNPYGLSLPSGLEVMSPFTGPVFTPTDKSETDDPLDSLQVSCQHHVAHALAHKVFTLIRDYLCTRGLELVDSKFELGVDPLGDCVRLADEIVTPDSS